MRLRLLLVVVAAACGSPSRQGEDPAPPARVREQEKDLALERETEAFTDARPVPRATDAEKEDFQRVWELFRRDDRSWPVERDRFKRRSDAAAYLLAGHLLRYYMQANRMRERASRELVRAKNEIVDVGEPCAPSLVDMMVLDRIPMEGDTWFYVDDLTRQDCGDMLERMGPPAVPHLLHALGRSDLSPKGRRLLALALGGTRDARAFEPLVRLLRTDPSWQVRADAATALAELGDRRALEPLREAERKDADAGVQRRAGKATKDLLGAGR